MAWSLQLCCSQKVQRPGTVIKKSAFALLPRDGICKALQDSRIFRILVVLAQKLQFTVYADFSIFHALFVSRPDYYTGSYVLKVLNFQKKSESANNCSLLSKQKYLNKRNIHQNNHEISWFIKKKLNIKTEVKKVATVMDYLMTQIYSEKVLLANFVIVLTLQSARTQHLRHTK